MRSQFVISAVKAMNDIFRGRLSSPDERVGSTVYFDNQEFRVYRETLLEKEGRPEAVLKIRYRPSQTPFVWRLKNRLMRKVAGLSTPFFAGWPGFRSRLWAVDEAAGEFLDVYEWDSVEAAEDFARELRSMLRSVSEPGSVMYQVAEVNGRLD